MGKLTDRIAVITGSDSGIGQATAIEFAKEGADVVVHYLHDEQGADHTREQVAKHGRRAIVVQADITREEELERIKTYVYGPFWSCRRFINERKKDGGDGKIINVTSIHDEVPRAGAADYVTGSSYVMDGALMQNTGQGA